MTVSTLFSPFQVRTTSFPNRIMVSPMCQYAATEGHVEDWHYAHHARFALSGVGGAILEATGVTRNGRITPGCLGLWSDSQIDGLSRITGLYRDRGIPVGIQLSHAGRKASAALPWDGAGPLSATFPEQAWPTVGPSNIAHAPEWPTPHALSVSEIDDLVDAFAKAATRALAAGFDFVEIHGAHGYLIHSFLSPLSNQRQDGYGGSPANRMRFALEVATAVRAAIPQDMPLFWRASAVDHDPTGLQIDDTVGLAKALKAVGVDVIDVSSGGINGPIARSSAPHYPGHQVPYSEQIRAGADIATMAVGLIMDGIQAEEILAAGKADLVAFGRELLADPAFAYRAAKALNLASPEAILPVPFAFYLARREQALSQMRKT